MTTRLLPASLLGAVLALGAGVLAQGPTLLKDIDPSPRQNFGALDSFDGFVALGSTLYFGAQTEGEGIELWRSDLTNAGTVLIKDAVPGTNEATQALGNPNDLFAFNGKVYYSYTTYQHGRELWVSDGTNAGTQLLKDIFAGPLPTTSQGGNYGFFVYNLELYFLADDGVHGRELWRTDGTPAGTQLAFDLQPGLSTGYPQGLGIPSPEFVDFGGVLFFTANGLLYRYLPTSPPTVTQVDPLSNATGIRNLTVYNGLLYFTANDPATGDELWSTDVNGTAITLVSDIFSGPDGSGPANLNVYNNLLIFTASDVPGTFRPTNNELWAYNGTFAAKVAEINPGASDSSFPSSFFAHPTGLFFTANDGTHGTELWKTDGTPGNTMLVADIRGGSSSSSPSSFSGFDNTRIIFRANDGVHGTEPWISDGTALGTMLVADVDPGTGSGAGSAQFFALSGGGVAFNGRTPNERTELWRTDGTPAGTMMIKDIRQPLPGQTNSSSTGFFTDSLRGLTLFQADGDGTTGTELWATDGTTAGTVMLKDINPGTGSSSPRWFEVSGQRVFFTANNGTAGTELWVTDCTPAGTQIVTDLRAGSSSGIGFTQGQPIGRINGARVLVCADDGVNGQELYVSDGSGLTLVSDLLPGPDSSRPEHFYYWNGKSYFVATTIAGSPIIRQLFVSDGTPTGTMAISGFPQMNLSLFENPWVEFKGELWIVCDDGITGQELYAIDRNNNIRSIEVIGGNPGGNPMSLTVWGDHLYFVANDGANGNELWRTDGTQAGTVMLKDINPFPNTGSNPSSLMALDNRLVFFADDGTNGYEVWATDGTPVGTTILKQIVPGPDGGDPGFGVKIGSRRGFFRASNEFGDEPWVTDGTAAGTVRIADINPGVSRSSPIDFTLVNGKLVFEATNPVYGSELWVYEIGASAKSVGRPSASATGSPIDYPQMTVSDPVLGGVFQIDGTGAVPTSGGYLVLGLPGVAFGGAPTGGEFLEPTFQFHHLYTQGFNVLLTFLPNPNGTWSTPIQLPVIPGLAGLPFALQTWFGPTAAPATISTSNGVYCFFGF